jgi:hypothetical protein
MRRRILFVLCLPAFALLFGSWLTLSDRTVGAKGSGAQGAVTAERAIESGLQRVIFTTRRGIKIFVNLPQDLRAGETSSGSVFGEASGKTDAERAAGNEELRSYVIEIAGQKIPPSGRTFELSIPATGLNDENSEVVLRDQKGKELAREKFEVSRQAASVRTDVRFPAAQLGEMLQVGCSCDGVMAGSDYIKVGGQTSLPIAESPRARWAFNTNPATGAAEIEINERSQVIKGKLNILGLKLSALKTGLLKGEQTTLTIELSGLEDLKEPLPLRLENQTPDVLTMAPSNVQELTIKPAEVRAGGKYITQRTLTGIRVGNFHIEGTVVRRDEPVSDAGRETAVTVNLPGDSEVARVRDALMQKIQNAAYRPPPAPQISLVSPEPGSLVKGSPLISWKVSGVPGEVQKVFYSVRIVEVLPEQSLEDALQKNPPALERTNLTENSFQVPREGGLANGKIYALRLKAFGPGGTELGSSRNSFFGIGLWPPWSFCILFDLGPLDHCIGQNLPVAYALMTGSGNYNWTLTPPGGSGTSTSPTITIPANMLPTTPGTYNYTLTVTHGTCTQSTSITINVFPAAAVGGAAVVAPAQICDGQTAVLDVQGESGNVGQWEYTDGGPWLNATGAFNIAGAPANTNQMHPSSCTAPNWYTDRMFRAVVSTSNNASAPSCSTTYSTPTTLRIYCIPVAGGLTASVTRYCKYSPPGSLTLSTSSPIGDFDWWSQASGGSAVLLGHHNQASFSIPRPTTTTTYWTVVTTNGPCPPVTSNSVTVIVDDQPQCLSATPLTADKYVVCPDDAAVLTVNNCSGIVTWQQGATNAGPWTTISSGNSVQNTTDLFTTTYWRALISGPPGGTCPQIISNVITINVQVPPPIPIVTAPAPVCFGGSATLTSNLGPLPTGTGWAYQWYHDDLPIPACNNLPNCNVAPAEPGNYWVEVTNLNGCQTVQSNFVVLPVDVITVAMNAPCCGMGGQVTLSATANSSLFGTITNQALFTWFAGGVQIATGTNQINVTPSTTTTYCVTVLSPNTASCAAQTCATVTVCP